MTVDMDPVPQSDGFRPTVVVVDNEPRQVRDLIQRLSGADYEVRPCSNASEAQDWLREHVADIVLIDIMLVGNSDNQGLQFAHQCAQIAPEAQRICISRLGNVRLAANDVLKALNLEVRGDSGVRLFEAFGDKHQPQEILDLVAFVRRHRCGRIAAPVECELEDGPSLHEVLSRRLADRNETTPELDKQFTQVVRGLAHRTAMPDATHIRLEPIERGRSRSLVFSMEVRYGKLSHAARTIVKVGSRALILQERDAYARHVPVFVHHGSYPVLEACAASRTLAGIAYGHLGTPEVNALPETFAGVFWRLDDLQIEQFVPRVFRLLVPQEGSVPGRAEPLIDAYRRRFRFLNNKDELAARSAGALKRWSGLLTQDAHGMWCATGDRNHIGKFGDPVGALEGDGVAFADYHQCVVHGDLHGDNIVLPEGAVDNLFLIDFAHTGEQHLFLDHVVLENHARFQLAEQIARQAAERHDGVFLEQTLLLEQALAAEACGSEIPVGALLPQYGKLLQFIRAIRRHAATRAGREEHSNYFAGVGLAALSCLGLPGEGGATKLIRSWLILAAAMNLDIANRRNGQCSLWGRLAGELNEDQRAKLYVEGAEPRFEAALRQVIKPYLEKHAEAAARLDECAIRLEQETCALQEEFPATIKVLSQISAKLEDRAAAEAKVKLVSRLGPAFLALQLEREVSLPASLREKVKALARILRSQGAK